jgi:hypothetical protein
MDIRSGLPFPSIRKLCVISISRTRAAYYTHLIFHDFSSQ